MSEVSAATIQQLTDAGVTIEIQDAAHRRVQARVPAARLQAVAQLAVVNSIRLPTYARRRTGAVTTEGDTILHADTVRATLGTRRHRGPGRRHFRRYQGRLCLELHDRLPGEP